MAHGSLHNTLYDRATGDVTPVVGMGATRIFWSDRHAATIIAVSRTGHKVTVQDDTATRTDKNGMSDAQSYDYAPNPNGPTAVYTRRKDGTYRERGGQGRLLINVRFHYHDFSF
jgi:hypothetical protein